MTDYISQGADIITPTLILGYGSDRKSRNIVHPIIGRSEPDITLHPASLRTGTLSMLFAAGAASGFAWVDGYYVEVGGSGDAEVDSKAAEDIHAAGGVFTLHSDLGTVAMSYVVDGSIRRTLDEQTRRHWIVEVGFQEVTL